MTKPVLQEPSFLILTALAAGPQHGYGIMADVASISGDRIKLRAGTLYAALDRLRSDGIIDVDREEVVDETPIDLAMVHRVVVHGFGDRVHHLRFEHAHKSHGHS